MRTFHKEKWPQRFICTEESCEEVLLFKGDLFEHKRNAHSNRNRIDREQDGDRFKCGQCNRKLSSKGNLKAHLKTHENEKDKSGWPKCVLCGKKYCDIYKVKDHILKAHSGEVEAGGIEKHIQGDRGRFQCGQCNKKISRKSSLKAHLQSHQNEKDKLGWPECGLCGKRYSSRMLVRKHILDVHSDRGK